MQHLVNYIIQNRKYIIGLNSFVIIGLLFLVILQVPDHTTWNSHDAGSQAAYEYWTQHGFSYGKDIFQNVGPVGFINYSRIYTGFLDFPKFILTIFLTGYVAFLLWTTSKNMPAIIRIIFLTYAMALAYFDPMLYLLSMLLLYKLVSISRWQNILLPVFTLALLALSKGCLLFISLFIIATSIISSLISRRFMNATLTMTSFIVFFLVVWVASGQLLTNLPGFIHGMLSFSSGYNEAMTIFEPEKTLMLGLTVFFGNVFVISLYNYKCINNPSINLPEKIQKLCLSITELFILFVVWKHGFVRADVHVIAFFQYALIAFFWIAFREKRIKGTFIVVIPLAITVSIASLMGIQSVYQTNLLQPLRAIYGKLENTCLALFTFHQYTNMLENALQNSVAGMQLPGTKALAGTQSVSYFGIFPAPMLYNGLNYKSNPSTISFAAWNEGIMKADAQFFGDDSQAPAFLLYDLRTIDGRLGAQDSSLAQLEILHRYKVRGVEAGNLVLEHVKGMPQLVMAQLSRNTCKTGEWVTVPQLSSVYEWVTIKIDERFLARMTSILYKPPQYIIDLRFNNGAIETYKFIPKMAATGFLINPLIRDNRDFLAAKSNMEPIKTTDSSLHNVVEFRITCNQQETLCGRKMTVAFKRVQGLGWQ